MTKKTYPIKVVEECPKCNSTQWHRKAGSKIYICLDCKCKWVIDVILDTSNGEVWKQTSKILLP